MCAVIVLLLVVAVIGWRIGASGVAEAEAGS
jgi:hypothetical protein